MKTLFASLLFIFLLSCQSNSGKPSESEYIEGKMSVEATERSEPTRFLEADGTYRENLLGTKFVLEGTIKNTATSVSYKNIVLDVTYYDAGKSEVGKQSITLFKTIAPNTSVEFKEKVSYPDGTNSVGFHVSSAEPE